METKLKVLALMSCASGAVSVIGSLLTLLTIHRLRQSRGGGSFSDSGSSKGLKTYERLLIGISFSDILFSISYALGPLPLPVSPSTPWAHGTTQTCTFQGVLAQLGSASFCYSLMLMIYYILVIRYNKSDAWISTRAEPVMHVIPICFFFSMTIVGIVWRVFNPSRGFRCWVGYYPRNCFGNPQVPCQRGEEHTRFFGVWLNTVPFLTINGLIIMSLAIIAVTVWRRHAASRRFVASNNSRRQSKQVITQCFLYALSFINIMSWSMIGTAFRIANVPYETFGKHYWLTVMSNTFLPLLGLFNFLIFIRPRYLTKRRDHARLVALKEAVWNPSSSLRRGQRGRQSSSKRTSATLSRSRNISNPLTANKSLQTDCPPRDEEGDVEEADPEALEDTMRSEDVSGRSSSELGEVVADPEALEQTTRNEELPGRSSSELGEVANEEILQESDDSCR